MDLLCFDCALAMAEAADGTYNHPIPKLIGGKCPVCGSVDPFEGAKSARRFGQEFATEALRELASDSGVVPEPA